MSRKRLLQISKFGGGYRAIIRFDLFSQGCLKIYCVFYYKIVPFNKVTITLSVLYGVVLKVSYKSLKLNFKSHSVLIPHDYKSTLYIGILD